MFAFRHAELFFKVDFILDEVFLFRIAFFRPLYRLGSQIESCNDKLRCNFLIDRKGPF